jgi:hypothetical protein
VIDAGPAGRTGTATSSGENVLDAEVTIQFRLGDPFVADAGQRLEQAALDQAEHGLVFHLQFARDFFSGINIHDFTSAFCLASHANRARGNHALVLRGEFDETDLVGKHTARPIGDNEPGWRGKTVWLDFYFRRDFRNLFWRGFWFLIFCLLVPFDFVLSLLLFGRHTFLFYFYIFYRFFN